MATDFSKGKVWRNILAQAAPLTVAQLVQLLYNIVDRIYIGHLPGADSTALTGIGLVFPLITLTLAFTNLLGIGGTPLFSINRGAGKQEHAQRILGQAAFLLLCGSLTLGGGFLLFRKPLMYLFGASDVSYPYANAYLRIYLLGTPFAMLSTGLNGYINAQGFPRIGMMTTVLGAVLNLVLDPLFIFALDMGVGGAALATVLSQMISCLWVLRFLTGKKAILPLRRKYIRFSFPIARDIMKLGVVGFIMQGTNSMVQISCNNMLSLYGGDVYVGLMTVINSVRELLSMPVHGVTNGAQPVLGFNYGAEKYDRVKAGIRFTTMVGAAYTCLVWLLVILIPGGFLRLFTPDPELLRIGPDALRTYFFGFCFMSLQLAGQSTFQALGCAKKAITFALFRKAVIVIPLTYLLPRLGLGVWGVFLAEPISNVLGGCASFTTMIFTVYRRLGKRPIATSAKL